MGIDARQLPAHLLPAPEWPQGTWWNPAGYRSARTRARLMYISMAVEALLMIAMAAYYLGNFDAVARAYRAVLESGMTFYFGALPPADALGGILGALALPVFIARVVAQLAWLSRSVDNSWYLLGGTPHWSPGWSIGWWFIPFANFVMPFLVVSDLNRRMAKGIGRPLFGLLLTWWLSGFVLFAIFMVVAFAYFFPAILPEGGLFTTTGEPPRFDVTLEEANTIVATTIGSQFVSLIVPLLTFVVYRRIQKFAEQREPYAVPPPPPMGFAAPPPFGPPGSPPGWGLPSGGPPGWGPPPGPPGWGPPPGSPPGWGPTPGGPPAGGSPSGAPPGWGPPPQWGGPQQPGSPPSTRDG